ncbi:MAG: hypothetical protein WBW41_06480 [Verrucomicrobiia bacterium]
MKKFCIGLIGLAGLAFTPMWPQFQSPKFQVEEPETIWAEIMLAVPTNQPHATLSVAADGPVFENSFPKFRVHNPEIIWAAPTNQPHAALWIYKVITQTFSNLAISNLMAMGKFTMSDEQNGHKKISTTNEDTLFFFDKKRGCNLTIVPSQGRIEYWDNYAPANHWDRTNHLWEQVAGLPDETKVKKLGLKFLKQFGIQPADLAQNAKNHLITFGEKQTRGYFDRRRGKYIDDEVTARGIFFDRRIDGVNFAGIGVGGGCEIVYGNHAKIADFKLVWRNLQPYEHHQVASPDEIMQQIREGKAVITHKNLVNPAEIKKLTITDCSSLYKGANGEETQDFVYPFAQIEAVADLGYTNVAVQLYCPILSNDTASTTK